MIASIPISFYRPRVYQKAKAFDEGIKISQDRCIISWDDSKKKYRGVMPCGHCFDPFHLFNYCLSQVIHGNSTIICPYVDELDPRIKCNTPWKYIDIKKVTMMNKEEKSFFEKKMSVTKIVQTKDYSMCIRCRRPLKALPSRNKMVCPHCQFSDKVIVVYCHVCRTPFSDKN